MNYKQFLNKEIINKNNERGVVTSFDHQYLVVRYQKEEKTYNPDIAFKSQFITFIDDGLNIAVKEYLLNKEKENKQDQELAEAIHKNIVTKNKRIMDYYDKISEKNGVLHVLFGGDFIYPPFVNFVKKYWQIISK